VTTPLLLLLDGARWEDRYQAVTLAVTAAAFGDPVTVALFFAPLRLWAEDRFDEGAPAEAAPARVAGLRQVLEEARRDLGVRVVACDTAVRLAGLEPDAVRSALDGVESLPALYRGARGGRILRL
jgi:peroxiredoxin family protein